MKRCFSYIISLPLSLLFIAGVAGCTKNQFADFADKDSDAALFAEAEILINDQRYLKAIGKLEAMSSKGRAARSTKRLYASAQAGDCGLNFFNFFAAIGDYDGTSGGGVFSLFMAGFSGTQVKPESCAIAMEVMRDLSAPDSIGRNGDDQLFMTILGMATMGTVLSEKADVDLQDGTGDGEVDNGFDICSSSDPEDVSDDMIAQLIGGFGAMLLNIGGLSGGDDVVDSVNDIVSACEVFKQDPNDPDEPNPCVVSDPANVTSVEIVAFRKLLHAEGFVPGAACDPNDMVMSCCPGLMP